MKQTDFRVTVTHKGVRFTIGHQGFDLHVEPERGVRRLDRNRWYAAQLRNALKRLKGSG